MKLPNGYGSVVKLSGNRRKPYAIRVSYWDTSGEIPKRKQRYIEYFSDQKAALTFLAEYNNGNIIKEHQKYSDVLTFTELYDKWEKYRRSLKTCPTEGTWRNYKIAYNMYSSIHDKKITSLKPQDLQECLTAKSSKSKTTIGNMRAIVRGMWEYAMFNEYVTKDITQYLAFEYTDSDSPIHTRFTDKEIKILWENLGVINNIDIILIYIYTGLRTSELLDITVENVFLDKKYMIGGSKTEAGKDRIIPLHEAIIPLVKFRLAKNRPYLITNKYGNHYTRSVYQNSNFNTVMNKLNMNHTPYDTRYTFASLADDVPLNNTCKKIIMGHSLPGKNGNTFKTGGTSDVTQDVYTEKTLEQLLKEVNKLPIVFE